MSTDETPDLRGLWVPIVTPFATDGTLDLDSLRRLAERLLSDGAAGLVALGTTGEPATLSPDERVQVVETCDLACRRFNRSLIVGAGTNSTQGTIDDIHRLVGGATVTVALVVVPYYTRPSERAVVEHFAIVADESPTPIVIYNIPYRTGRALHSHALLQASAHPRIVGLKQAVGAVDADTLDLLARSTRSFQVLAGDDAFITPTVLMGGAGAIAAAAHLCTPLFVEMTAAALSADVDRATQLAGALLPVVRAGFDEPSPAVWNAALAYHDEIASPSLRRPMTPASTGAVGQLLAAAAEADRSTRPPVRARRT